VSPRASRTKGDLRKGTSRFLVPGSWVLVLEFRLRDSRERATPGVDPSREPRNQEPRNQEPGTEEPRNPGTRNPGTWEASRTSERVGSPRAKPPGSSERAVSPQASRTESGLSTGLSGETCHLSERVGNPGAKSLDPAGSERPARARASRTERDLATCFSEEPSRARERVGSPRAKPRDRASGRVSPRASRTSRDLPKRCSLEASRARERVGSPRAKPPGSSERTGESASLANEPRLA
jgi:hypothetical protein